VVEQTTEYLDDTLAAALLRYREQGVLVPWDARTGFLRGDG
jgi:hypothetical protein